MMNWKSIALCTSLLMVMSCSLDAQRKTVNGEGPMVKVDFDLDRFTEIALSMQAEVTITKGSPQRVTVEGQQNIIDIMSREVRGNTWGIGSKDGKWRMRNYQKLKVTITMAELNGLAISGSGNVRTTNSFSSNKDFELAISGSGDADLQLSVDDIEIAISGSGNAHLVGQGNNMEISISGSGDVKAEDMKVKTCEVSTAGSGRVEITVSESLEASLVGSGDVLYRGKPKVRVSSVGSGKVRSMSE